MKLEQMTPALRKAAVAALARDLAGRQRPHADPEPPARTRARSTMQYRCAACGELSATWAAAERHAGTARHPRIQCVLDATTADV